MRSDYNTDLFHFIDYANFCCAIKLLDHWGAQAYSEVRPENFETNGILAWAPI